MPTKTAEIASLLTPVMSDIAVIGDAALRLDGRDVSITGGVVRFRTDEGYNSSFARQWKTFRLTQLDAFNGTTLTRDRYLRETGWPSEGLDGEIILEAGCGAGRFTPYLCGTGARVVSIDYSTAVDANAESNSDRDNVVFAQADILDLPFTLEKFDRVFCHGVLQHTADPRKAFEALNRVLKPGGLISFDVYLKDGKIRPWKSKYLWRPITRRMDEGRLLKFLERFIPLWLPFDTCIKRLPILGNYLGAVIPCWNYFYAPLRPDLKVKWAILDTFDALAPTYDLPVTLDEVRTWFVGAGYCDYEVREGGNGVVGNGRKPAHA